jgi:membrane fusion protein (multidrug efflux system)
MVSFSPTTGSRFYFASDNATGNFVKTIQRLPVKISIDPTMISKSKIITSGNVDVDVHIK